MGRTADGQRTAALEHRQELGDQAVPEALRDRQTATTRAGWNGEAVELGHGRETTSIGEDGRGTTRGRQGSLEVNGERVVVTGQRSHERELASGARQETRREVGVDLARGRLTGAVGSISEQTYFLDARRAGEPWPAEKRCVRGPAVTCSGLAP